MSAAITLGAGKKKPAGRRRSVANAAELAQALREHGPNVLQAWWSPIVWMGDLRDGAEWEAACGVVLDLDTEGHADVSPELAQRLEEAVRDRALPGSIFHRTPAGARLVFLLEKPTDDRGAYQRAAYGAAGAVMAQLAELDLSLAITPKEAADLARIAFAPTTGVKGRRRSAEVVVMREEPYSIAELHRWAAEYPVAEPAKKEDPTPKANGSAVETTDVLSALRSAGLYRGEAGSGKHTIVCPWSAEHTTGEVEAVYFPPSAAHPGGGFSCLHAHCTERTIGDLRRYLGIERKKKEDDATAVLDLDARWVSFDPAEILADPPRVEWIWEHRIPRGEVGVFSASGSSGKTSLLTGLALHRAMGRPFLGKWCRQGTTVIVTTEDRRDDYRRKIGGWRDHLRDLDADAVARHVHLIDLRGQQFRLVRAEYGVYFETAHVRMLADVVRRRAPTADLIVIETVSRVGAGEDNAALSALVVAAEQLSDLTGAAVLLVSHVSQEAGRQGVGDQYASRGGSALPDNGRFALTLARLLEKDAAKLLPGITVSEEQLGELMVLRGPKVNSAPRQDPAILQRVPTAWSLVLREYDRGAARTSEEIAGEERRRRGEALRDLARRYVALGEDLTETTLRRGGLYRDLALPRNEISTAILDALADGYLRRDRDAARGGGKGRLVPTPSVVEVHAP